MERRHFTFDRIRANKEERVVEASISSEAPVERSFGTEVLEHSQQAIDLSRSPLPILTGHNSEETPIGIAENLHVKDKKLRGSLRFGKSARALEIWQDISDGIIRGVSIGYNIVKTAVENDIVRVTRWEPLEVSLVAIPADNTVGIGRSKDSNSQRSNIMSDEDKKKLEGRVKVEANNAREAERVRVAELLAYGKQFNCQDEATKAVSDGRSVEEFRTRILERMKGKLAPIQGGSDELGLTRQEKKRYSLVRAIRLLVDQKFARDQGGIELEASKAMETRMKRETQGLLIPMRDLQRGYLKRDITVGGTGQYLVQTDVLAQDFIDLLRNRTFVLQAGARMLTGLIGDVSIPRKSASATAYWLDADGTDTITESTPTLGAVQMAPKTVAGLVDVSHKQLIQSSLDVEAMIRQDLVDTIAVAIDLAALAGTGTNNQPTGILATSGIGSNTYANGGHPDYADIVTLESDIASANADVSGCSYMTTPAMRATLKQVFTNATYGEIPLWTPGAEPGAGNMNGYRAFATAQMTSGYVLAGDFSQMLIAEWNLLELLADPYGTNFAKGTVSIRAMYDCDIGVRHPAAFSELHEHA